LLERKQENLRNMQTIKVTKTNQQTEQYQPLPHNLAVKESPIHNLGIFAIEDIEKDTLLGITHVYNKGFLHSWIRTPLGGFYNHSDTPNCILVDSYLGAEFVSTKTLVTLKDISAGDEITCTYTLYSI
jgi:SET domain-containing protein